MWSIKKIPSNLSNWISFLRKMHFSNESRKRKTNCSWPLTLIMQKHDHFRFLRHHYSDSPVIPLSNDIWYRYVAHEFITFYFLIFYLWSKYIYILHNKHATTSNTMCRLTIYQTWAITQCAIAWSRNIRLRLFDLKTSLFYSKYKHAKIDWSWLQGLVDYS